MTVIELGDLGAQRRPAVRSPRHRLDRLAVRRWAVAVVAVLCAVTMTGSTRPGTDLLPPLWSVPMSRSSVQAVGATAVFVLSVDEDGARVTAYDLAGGSVLWSRPFAVSRIGLTAEDPRTLLVPVGPGTVALDQRTGTQLWQQPGDVVRSTPEDVLLAEPGGTVRRVRISDGAVLWSRTVPDAQSWASDGSTLVAARHDGRVDTLRVADGAPLASTAVPPDDTAAGDGGISVSAGTMYLNRSPQTRATVTAYDLGTLRARWQAVAGTPGATPDGDAHACGPVVCFTDGIAIAGLDPGTGAQVWIAKGWTSATPIPGTGRLIVAAPDAVRHALLDSATGARIADLGTGSPILDGSVLDASGASPAYYLQDAGDDRTAVSSLDPVTGGRRLRGMIDGVGFAGCGATGGRLICGTADGRLTVTAVG